MPSLGWKPREKRSSGSGPSGRLLRGRRRRHRRGQLLLRAPVVTSQNQILIPRGRRRRHRIGQPLLRAPAVTYQMIPSLEEMKAEEDDLSRCSPDVLPKKEKGEGAGEADEMGAGPSSSSGVPPSSAAGCSPDVLAAAGLQMMVPFLRSHVARSPDTHKIDPGETIDLPAALTYSYIGCTGAILAKKHQAGVDAEERPKPKANKRPSTGSQPSATKNKKEPPVAPVPTGEVQAPEGVSGNEADDDGEEEEEEEDEGEGNIDLELEKVDAIEAKAKPKAKPKIKAKTGKNKR